MLPCHLVYNGDLGLSDFAGINARYACSLLVHVEHDSGSFLGILGKDGLQDHDDKVHGSVIVIVEDDLIQRWFLQDIPSCSLLSFLKNGIFL